MKWLIAGMLAFLVGCVGDASVPGGGPDASGMDAGSDAPPTSDGGNGVCVFGSSHFGDGCKFGP